MRLRFQSDSDLVKKALADQPEAFEGLVLRYQKKAFAIARSVGVRGEVDDVVQEAFLRAWRELRNLRTPTSFGPWLLQIVRNAAREQLLERAVRQGPPAAAEREVGEASPAEAATVPSPLLPLGISASRSRSKPTRDRCSDLCASLPSRQGSCVILMT